MAARDLKVLIKTLADVSGLTKLGQHLKNHSIAVKGLVGTYQAVSAAGQAAFSAIGSALRIMRNSILGATAALAGISIKGVRSFMEADDAAESLKASLISLGYNADTLMPSFQELATEIQRTTRVGDDQVLSLAGLLLNYGVLPEKIDEAIKGSIGLAKAMRIDEASAAQYLAMAMEGEFATLSRYIPALRVAKTESEKMAIVQKVMASGFNQAQASASTLSGRWDQLKNRIGDLWERIGQAVSEALNLTGAFAAAERAVAKLIDSAVFDKITTGLRDAALWLVAQAKTAVDLIKQLQDSDFGVAKMATVAKTVVAEIINMAVTLLLAQIEASIDVFIGIAKVVAAVFEQEIYEFTLKHGTGAQKEGVQLKAQGVFSSMKYADRAALAQRYGFRDEDALGEALYNKEGKSGNESIIAEIAASGARNQLPAAFGKTKENLKDVKKKVETQYDESKSNIKTTINESTGGAFNWDERFAANRGEIASFMSPVPTKPAAGVDQGKGVGAIRNAAKPSDLPAPRTVPVTETSPHGQRALAALQLRLEAEKGDEAAVAEERAGNINPNRQGLLNKAATEARDVAKVEKAIQQVLSGNQDTIARVLSYLQQVEQQNKQIKDQIRRLPL